MSRVISLQVCGIVLDELYHNACKPSVDQVSMDVIRKKCKVSINTVLSFRNLLINHKLLIVDGQGRGIKYEWNSQRSAMNPEMAKHLYNVYLGAEKRKVKLKVKTDKPKERMSVESALKYLANHGFTGELKRKVNAYTIEIINVECVQ